MFLSADTDRKGPSGIGLAILISVLYLPGVSISRLKRGTALAIEPNMEIREYRHYLCGKTSMK
jgi:hypothetical protein